MPVVNVSSSMRIGVLSDFAEMYKNRYPTYAKRQDKFIKRGTVKTRFAEYAMKESIPMPEFWGYNTPRTRKTFHDKYLTLHHYPFELSIMHNKFDAEDDVIGDLKAHVATMTNRFLQIPDIMVVDYLQNAATLQPALSTALDGVALFSATDGAAAARFGVTGGNIITSSGVGTTAAVLHDIFAVQQRFLQFQDTEGQPFYSPEEVDIDKFTVVVPSHLNEVFMQANEAKLAYVNTAVNTSQENILAKKFNLWINPRLSTSNNDWYVLLEHEYLKPFFYIERDTIKTIIEDESNDHVARDLWQEGTLAHIRTGMAIFAPMAAVQVNS